MSFAPEPWQYSGLSLEVAECYGKPHIGAYYRSDNVKSHTRCEAACCACCGRPATNVHHCPPLSCGRSFLLCTPLGRFVLKPALFALCGSGTQGCHNGFHGGARFCAHWIWECDAYAKQWWNGYILAHFLPHSPELYRFGYWEISDAKTGRIHKVHTPSDQVGNAKGVTDAKLTF